MVTYYLLLFTLLVFIVMGETLTLLGSLCSVDNIYFYHSVSTHFFYVSDHLGEYINSASY